MKKETRRFLLLGIATLVLVGLRIQLIPYGHNHANPPPVQEPNWNSPETRAIAKRACFDCHSNETVWPWCSSIAPVSWLVYRNVVGGSTSIFRNGMYTPRYQKVKAKEKNIGGL